MSDLMLNGVVKTTKTPYSRHKTPRRSVALNFTNALGEYATTLDYWAEIGVITPLMWAVIDSLADKGADVVEFMKNEDPNLFVKEFIQSLSD